MPSASDHELPNAEVPILAPDEALALLRSADANFQAGNNLAARTACETLVAAGMFGQWAHFFLGRFYRESSDDGAAMDAFTKAIDVDPAMFWAHFERLVLARDNGAPMDRLADFVSEIVAVKWEDLQPPHVDSLQSVAHALWDSERVDVAGQLFVKLWPSENLSQLSLVRLAETTKDSEVRAQVSARLESFPELDEASFRLLSNDRADEGSIDREIMLLKKRQAAAPQDFQTWLSLVRSYARKPDRERALATLEQENTFGPRQRSFVSLIAHLELGDLDTAFYEFRKQARLYGEIPKYPGIRLTYLLSDAFDVPRRNEVLALITSAYEDDPDIGLVRVNAAVRDQRWADARALFDGYFAEMETKPQSARLAHIDILAFSGKLQEAGDLLDAEFAEGASPPSFLRAALRIYGELGRWDKVFSVGLDNLANDSSFEHFLSVMVRAGRKTGRSEELFEGLLALPQPLKRSQLDALYAVMEDLAEAGHSDIIARIGDIPLPFEREHRIALKLRGAEGPAPVAKDLCIYYCADKTYLLPALVSLTALALSNVSITRRAVFHIVVDSDVVDFATEASGAIARRLGLDLKVVDASTIVSSADRLRTSYGIFTGGQELALAAYYRIFFARYLAEKGEYSQALYIDADTVVRSGLDELFAAERDTPLMARYEIDRPEVHHATEVHQLQGRYFNSGVLSFDLKHPLLPELLDRAIAAAIDPDVQLIFQDQCALNIAFDMNLSELPERFNYFNPPTISGDGISATDAVIVHFLDRPKPWDSLYRRRAREWFEWYDLVETLRQSDTQAG